MNKKLIFFLFLVLFFPHCLKAATPAEAQGSLQSSNLLNPNISAIGWFQAEVGHRKESPIHPNAEEDAFQLKEAEIAFQAIVDPYSKAEFIVSITNDGAELEEGTITWFTLPYDLALKAGKFKANFGRFNRVHAGETAFADRPLVEEAYFGEEGLSGSGASVSWHVPNPLMLLNLDVEAISPPTDDNPSFQKAIKGNLLYVSRLGGYLDLTEATNISFGSSYSNGPAGQELDSISNSSVTLKSEVYGLDLTFRWKNPRRAVYRSFTWNTEALWSNHDVTSTSKIFTHGMFTHMDYQFAKRWRIGGRYDYSETPTDKKIKETGGLCYLTFTPSEFSLISLQGRHVNLDDGTHEDLAFLKTTFNIGPHGAHPF